MQGYKGTAAPHPYHRSSRDLRRVVVRAVVDQASQRAALLLEDSSCLLVSLGLAQGSGGSSAVAPITVPAPCSDACFLRLHACYGLAGAAGKGGGGNGVAGSPARLGLGELGQGESPTFRENGGAGKGGGGGGNGKGRAGAGVRRELCIVTARPGKGGSCTELRAWSCGDGAFGGADVELEPGDGRVRASGRGFARLDAPHGLAVKMAASINVLVVYSSSAGKFWIMAGKWSGQTGGPAQNVRPENVFGAEEYERKRLILMKRAIVSCYGPVYSIHVSSLHLFLGESKGVRVWSLRPLIKPGSAGKSSGQSKARFQGAFEQGSHQSDCENCGRGERCQHITEAISALGKVDEKKSFDNGPPLEENGDVRVNIGGMAMKRISRKGLYTARESNVGASVAGLGNYRNPKVGSGASSRFGNFEFRSLSELQVVLKADLSPGFFPAEDEFEGKMTIANGGGGLIENETHNGILRSYPAEHGEISVRETLMSPKLRGHTEEDSATSNPEVSRLHECNGDPSLKSPQRRRNGLTPVAEALLEAQVAVPNLVKKKSLHQSAESVLATGSRVQSRKAIKNLDPATVWFVALSYEEEVITAQSSSQADRRPCSQLQVVDIQGLGLKEYVVLDSKGELHLLTLHEVSEEQKSEFPGQTHLTIRRLRSTMRVTSFAVLPLPPPLPQAHQDSFSPAAATVKRKLWISDGTYSIHVVVFPEEKIKASLCSSRTESILPVSQAVFMKDRVDGLIAASPDTVVVLMKGRLVSYAIPGD